MTEHHREVATLNVIDSRLVNVFFDKATLSEANSLPDTTSRLIDGRRRKQGGLWVGGKCQLTATALSFRPNDMNRALHARPDELNVEVPLEDIIGISVERRLITDTITVRLSTGVLKIRCFKAKSFAASIEATRLAMR
ncbi:MULTISPECIES: hypothetical protein [Brucella/Ochrobactrum group]|uniref:Uncharacterized protein n=1 Tax=Brucella anthropi TaxID=529 RepID=A0A6L3Z1G0_BRUAN|nr:MULTISPECIES: hypothetical protein [Brucella]KAB2764306.1 hypothetical protein F9L04_20205 [Brucella anthropi]MCI1002660.1 hypothetical protein [Ochrobactrum sp. C6C9]